MVYYDGIDKSEILNIHKHSLVKNIVKKCLDLLKMFIGLLKFSGSIASIANVSNFITFTSSMDVVILLMIHLVEYMFQIKRKTQL